MKSWLRRQRNEPGDSVGVTYVTAWSLQTVSVEDAMRGLGVTCRDRADIGLTERQGGEAPKGIPGRLWPFLPRGSQTLDCSPLSWVTGKVDPAEPCWNIPRTGRVFV